MIPRAVRFAFAAAFLSPAALAEFDRAALMREAAAVGFEAAEQKRLAAAASEDADAVLGLARFYIAHEFWIEALAALRRLGNAPSDGARLLIAECQYRMGRDAAALAALPQGPAPLRAMALARIGAYGEAAAEFQKADIAATPQALRADFQFLKAEALAATGDAASAAAAVNAAPASIDNPDLDTRREFVIAMIRAARGDAARAATSNRRAAAGVGEWAARARLAIAVEARDVEAIEKSGLEWSGGAFERERGLALGELRLAGGDFDRGFAALRKIVDRSPGSDAATRAQTRIAETLPTLFAAESKLHPKDAARLFFEHVEFAPPGAEGDTLIRRASDDLAALGLERQAAQLLEHQVFKRLRGAERARVAADLAETYLAAGEPREALRVIRSTRLAGLDDDVAMRRNRIEARALAAAGEAASAVRLLESADARDDLLLRAEINWSQRAWGEAARDYAAYVAGLASFEAARDRDAAVRGATAFLLAGDRTGYRAYAAEAAKRLEGRSEARLIESLGDVDSDRFMRGVMESYRALYRTSG